MADQRPSFKDIPIYDSFFEEPEKYERYHIHLIGLRNSSGSTEGGIANRRSIFGFPRVFDAVAHPYAIVETFGSDTGSADHFPIGKHTFGTLKSTQLPLWDAKCTLIGRKTTTEGLRFFMHDGDEVLMEFSLPRTDLPSMAESLETAEWKEFVVDGTQGLENMKVVLKVMITDGSHRVVSKEATEALYQDTEVYKYTEEILADATDDPEDNALLQCWRQTTAATNNNKAVLWVLVRLLLLSCIHSCPWMRLFLIALIARCIFIILGTKRLLHASSCSTKIVLEQWL
jgi:predicted nucleic acid-binding protein